MPVARVHLRLGRSVPTQQSSTSSVDRPINSKVYQDNSLTGIGRNHALQRQKSRIDNSLIVDADSVLTVSSCGASVADDRTVGTGSSPLPSLKRTSKRFVTTSLSEDVIKNYRPNLLQSVAVEIKRSYDHLLKFVDDDDSTNDGEGDDDATIKSSSGLRTQEGWRNIVRIAALPVK